MTYLQEFDQKKNKRKITESIEEDIVQASSDGNDEGYMESDEDVSIS